MCGFITLCLIGYCNSSHLLTHDVRSPSPEPIYSTDGKRLNTREYRTRKKMEDDRHNLVQELIALNPEYKPPTDYKWVSHPSVDYFIFLFYRPPQNRITDKVFIPQENHPDINFVGLLIGPRGNTLKALEKEVGDVDTTQSLAIIIDNILSSFHISTPFIFFIMFVCWQTRLLYLD